MSRRFLSLLALFDAVTNANIIPLETGTSGHAKPTRALTALRPRETGQVGLESDYINSSPELIEKRVNYYFEQQVYNFCPEDVGRDPKSCDMCGGDSYHHGICNNILLSGRQSNDCVFSGVGCEGYFCECDHDGEDHDPKVTSTTVVGGQTGTVIYEPIKLTQFSNLRSHTTFTLTDLATATRSDDPGALETALVVVFAGGIAWLAISEEGGAAAIAELTPPEEVPEDAEEDDERCDSDLECPDCGGSNGWGLCSSGSQTGCPCEEKQDCPNDPPMCSDTQCGGDNGQSQCSASGEINGCTCCPDDAPLCSDNDCIGGALQLCTKPKLLDCGCYIEADSGGLDLSDDSDGVKNPSSSISSVASYVFTAVWDADYESVIGYPTPTPKGPIADDVDLRVLPIGDSITWGAQSSDDNGYRKRLFDMLAKRGNDIDFVGGETSGTMRDNHHEGHRGFFIEGIGQSSHRGIYAAPNIVLLHAGTNDVNKSIEVETAPQRLGNLIDLILEHSPKAAVLVCQIIPSRRPDTQERIKVFNKAVPGIVSGFAKKGKRVHLVDMYDALTQDDIKDELHPNDGGYAKMAQTWYDAIVAVDKKGWISKPGTPTTADDCQSTPSWYKEGKIADGAKVAKSDGDFEPSWYKKGKVAEGACNDTLLLHFMDLDGDGLKDYACVDHDTGKLNVHLNIPDADGKTSGKWKDMGVVAKPKEVTNGLGVIFGDLNGDGRDDYIYLDADTGDLYGWINRLKGDDGTWQWQSIGRIARNLDVTDYLPPTPRLRIQMVDLDGDGRDDLCVVDQKSGEMKAWLNTGADIIPDYYSLGRIATGLTTAAKDTVVLGDFTGEGRADYMKIGKDGKVTGLVNRLQADTLIPRWLETITLADGPKGTDSDEVRLVDMTGDGKVDYLVIDEDGGITLWENQGKGGKYQPGEGVVLCDLDGDGVSDYFWLDEKGRGWGYLNTGKGSNGWKDLGQITDGPVRDRNLLRMGVLTHSGRADYILVEEKTGRASWWQNLGSGEGWGWASRGEAATGPQKTIEDKYGWKFSGKNVRFADLDGDGFDDYLYVNNQGAVVMWKNLGTNPITWGLPHLVADGVGVLADQVQFADTDGDGLLDYVVVGSVTGKARSWHNLGFREDRSIRWNTPLDFADGVGVPGRSVVITDMTGDDRADYVTIHPDTGRLDLWRNRCLPV